MGKCITCLQVQAKHPQFTARELSPAGSFEAVTTVNGSAYCVTHALMVAPKSTNKEG